MMGVSISGSMGEVCLVAWVEGEVVVEWELLRSRRPG